jgi:DUF4097 and DUF4098 domain-containing protein YvlB
MEFIRTLDVKFDVGDATRLSVESRSGTVAVRGDGGRSVRVEVVARLWAEDDDEADDQAELIRRAIQLEGDKVMVKTPALLRPRPFLFFGHSRPRVDYQITVPTKTEAKIDSRSGVIEVEAIAGPLRIDSSSGKVSVRDVTTDVEIQSRSGTVQVESIGGSLDAESRSGSMRIKGCGGDASLEARSGSLTIENVGGRLKAGTRSGSVKYEGGVHGSFDIDVTSGSVRLALNPDSHFFLDAEAISGSVTSDLRLREDGSGGRPPKDAPKVRIRTVSGGIHIASN